MIKFPQNVVILRNHITKNFRKCHITEAWQIKASKCLNNLTITQKICKKAKKIFKGLSFYIYFLSSVRQSKAI